MKNLFTLFIFFVATIAFSQTPMEVVSKPDSIAMKFAATITEEDLKEDLTILASDALEGRETGKRGQKMAAAYLSTHFEELGLAAPVTAGGIKSYYQDVKLKTSEPGDIYLIVKGKKYKNLKDGILYYGSEKNTDEISAEVVFAGSGAKKDFENIDVKGKSVLIINTDRDGRVEANKNAKKNGANFMFIVRANSDEEFDEFGKKYAHYFSDKKMSLDENTNSEETLGLIYVSPSLAGAIMNQPFSKLTKSISNYNAGKSKAFRKIKHGTVAYKLNYKTNHIISENVLGYLEGTDLKDEVIVITSHYDHIGIQDGKVHNGADDDGSGTVAVLEIAEAFAKAKEAGKGPRRSILFMNVTAEEKGLLGSKYYASNPIFPLENTVVNLNIDMIGRTGDREIETTNYVYLIGADKLSSELHNISEEMNKTYTKMYLDYTFNDEAHPERFYYRSDHWNFAKNGIPIIFYFNGVHADYHKHTDTVDKIEFDMLKKRTQLVFYTAWEIANRDNRLVVDKKPASK